MSSEAAEGSREEPIPEGDEMEVFGGRISEIAKEDPNSLCGQWREILRAHSKSLDWLEEFINENPDRITDGPGQIWIRGNLARYSFEKEALLGTVRNQFSSAALDCTTILPLISGEGEETQACIQMLGQINAPSADSIKGFMMALISDEVTFDRIGTLRNAIIGMYGIRKSPISDVLNTFIDERYDATYDPNNGVIDIAGSNNWRWRIIEDIDKNISIEVLAARRKNWRYLGDCFEDGIIEPDTLGHLLWLLSNSPQAMIDEPFTFIYSGQGGSEGLSREVAKFHAPLRIVLDVNNLIPFE